MTKQPTWQTMKEWCLLSARIAARLPRVSGPSSYKTAWPVMEKGFDDYGSEPVKSRRPPPSAQDVSLMERFVDLVNTMPDQVDRVAIYTYGNLRCRKGRSIAGYLRQKGENHGNYNRVLQQTFQKLAVQATVQKCPIPRQCVASAEKMSANGSTSGKVERKYKLYTEAVSSIDNRTEEQKRQDREALIRRLNENRERAKARKKNNG